MIQVRLEVNAQLRTLEVRASELLIETLRDRLGLLGTKYACLEGECGACTVLLDGKNILACLMLTIEAEGRKITTIEGLAPADAPHPLQTSFIEKGAIQCGFCTPGMILAAHALLKKNPDPTDEEIARGMDGNLCRCTGYIRIIEAIRDAAHRQKVQD